MIKNRFPELYEKIKLTKKDQQKIVKMIKLIQHTGGIRNEILNSPTKGIPKFNKKKD